MHAHLDDANSSPSGPERGLLDEALFAADEGFALELPVLPADSPLPTESPIRALPLPDEPAPSVGILVETALPEELPPDRELPVSPVGDPDLILGHGSCVEVCLPSMPILGGGADSEGDNTGVVEEVSTQEWLPDEIRGEGYWHPPTTEPPEDEPASYVFDESDAADTAADSPNEPQEHFEVSPPPLELVHNTGLTLPTDATAEITSRHLYITGMDLPALVDIMLLSPPMHGVLLRDGFALTGGDLFTQEDIDLGRIKYRHDGAPDADDSFTFGTPDGQIEEVFTITLLPAHLAPELLGEGQLSSVIEGCWVVDILAGGVRCHDDEVQAGLAVVGVAGRGQWQYSLDGGQSWHDIHGSQPGRALLLAPTSQLRFVPRPGWSGQVKLTYRAWDGTSGRPGDLIDLSDRNAVGGTTAFSAELTTVTTSVSAASPEGLPSVPEPWLTPITPEELVGTGMAVVRLQGEGIWQYSLDDGRSWNDFGEVYHGRARVLRPRHRVRFLPRRGGSGRVLLGARTWDGEGATAGGTVNLARHGATGGETPFGGFVQTRKWRLGG